MIRPAFQMFCLVILLNDRSYETIHDLSVFHLHASMGFFPGKITGQA